MITMQHFVHPDGCDTIGMCLDSGQTMGILWESYEKTMAMGISWKAYGKLYSLWILWLLGINYRSFEGGINGVLGVFPPKKWARWPGLHNWAPLGCGPCQTQRPGRMAASHQAYFFTHKKKEDWSTMDTVENTYTNIYTQTQKDR